MPEVTEVAFELERFAWTPPDQLEVSGRWSGLEGRRLGRPVLTLEIDGKQEKLAAHPGGHFGRGGKWRALFTYDGEPEAIASAELEIGRRLVVDLAAAAPPQGSARRRGARRGAQAPRGARGDAGRARGRDRRPARRGGDRDRRPRHRARDAAGRGREAAHRHRGDAGGTVRRRGRARPRADRARGEPARRRAAARRRARRRDGDPREARDRARGGQQHDRDRGAGDRAPARGAAVARARKRSRPSNAERAETARLREELATRPANGDDDTGEADEAARRMYERVARELEQERAAARSLRRELDAVQAADRRAPPSRLGGERERHRHGRRRTRRRHARRPVGGVAADRGRARARHATAPRRRGPLPLSASPPARRRSRPGSCAGSRWCLWRAC